MSTSDARRPSAFVAPARHRSPRPSTARARGVAGIPPRGRRARTCVHAAVPRRHLQDRDRVPGRVGVDEAPARRGQGDRGEDRRTGEAETLPGRRHGRRPGDDAQDARRAVAGRGGHDRGLQPGLPRSAPVQPADAVPESRRGRSRAPASRCGADAGAGRCGLHLHGLRRSRHGLRDGDARGAFARRRARAQGMDAARRRNWPPGPSRTSVSPRSR